MECPDCGRDVYGKTCACGWGKPAQKEKPPEPVRCCLCKEHVNRQGWCAQCRTWPVNITPIRTDSSGHTVSPSGWCHQCGAYTMTELDAQPGEWRDTGRKSRKLTKEEVQQLAREVASRLVGPGWPECIVPLREDMVPRRWKNAALKEVGTTPLGFKIVLPDRQHTPEPAALNDVPF